MDQSASNEPAKRCTGPCGEIKPLVEFGKDISKRDGLRSQCRICTRKADRRPERAEAKRRRYAANPERYRRRRDPEKRREYERRRYAANPARYREAKRRDYAANPEKYRARDQQYRERGTRGRLRLIRVRGQVFAHYGTCCACCGSTADLTIDHMVMDGAVHRAERFSHRGGLSFYLWLIREGFPGGYQTLCRPCNSSKATGLWCRLTHEG